MAVFVPFELPGERAEVAIAASKGGFTRGTVSKLMERSPQRIEPGCRYFGTCGGCHYQHIPYSQQLEFKAGILRETLQRIAKIELKSEMVLHGSPPWNYRNRTRLQVRTAPEFALGYYRFASHEFLEVRECPISSPLINRVLTRMYEMKGCNSPAGIEEIELFATADDSSLLAWAFCGRDADAATLLRWAEDVRSAVPEITGLTFFP